MAHRYCRAAFIKHAEPIAKRLAEGYTMKHVYGTIPEIGMSYAQFVTYCHWHPSTAAVAPFNKPRKPVYEQPAVTERIRPYDV